MHVVRCDRATTPAAMCVECLLCADHFAEVRGGSAARPASRTLPSPMEGQQGELPIAWLFLVCVPPASSVIPLGGAHLDPLRLPRLTPVQGTSSTFGLATGSGTRSAPSLSPRGTIGHPLHQLSSCSAGCVSVLSPLQSPYCSVLAIFSIPGGAGYVVASNANPYLDLQFNLASWVAVFSPAVVAACIWILALIWVNCLGPLISPLVRCVRSKSRFASSHYGQFSRTKESFD